MTDDMLEIMIGKFLDGQITASEQRLLEAELDNNFEAKELLTQLQDLHQRSRVVIAAEVLDRGKDAEEIFEQAWQQHKKHPLIRVIKTNVHLRFVTGLAAGLIIGLTLHFVLFRHSTPYVDQTRAGIAAHRTDSVEGVVRGPSLSSTSLGNVQNVNRNVDWYIFTDKNGNQWLVQGLRENIVRTASLQDAL